MSGTNIFMQLITKDTIPVVLGEAMLDGYQGSIELKDFSWGMQVLRDATPNPGGGFGSLSGTLGNLVGAGKSISVQLQPLSFTKRFDVSSSRIHTCIDKHINVVSCSITVVHVRAASTGISIPGVGSIGLYMPGFVLLATDGYFSEVKVDIQSDGNMAEVVEVCKLNFQRITMTYLKSMLGTNLPTLPFTAGQNTLSTPTL